MLTNQKAYFISIVIMVVVEEWAPYSSSPKLSFSVNNDIAWYVCGIKSKLVILIVYCFFNVPIVLFVQIPYTLFYNQSLHLLLSHAKQHILPKESGMKAVPDPPSIWHSCNLSMFYVSILNSFYVLNFS